MARRSFDWWLPRVMIAVGSAAMLIGSALVAFGYYDSNFSRSWEPVAALVTGVDIDQVTHLSKTSDGVGWVPNVHYSYTVAGRVYQANRVFAGDSEHWGHRPELVQFLRSSNYVRGRTVTAYYDAGEPGHAALILRLTWSRWIIIVLLGLMSLGFGLLMKKEDADRRKRRELGL